MALKPKYQKTVFGNGLTLLTERHTNFKSLSVGIWVKAGARHETAREAGISHFLEHMLFKGTKTRSALEIAREVDQVGGEFNAFTAREYTCFHILMLDRNVDLGLDILMDVILNSSFESEEMERERKVILQEIAMVEESPEEMIHDIFFEQTYGKHGLGRPILGSETSVRRMKRSDLLKFFHKHYRPERMIVSVAGNVSHDQIKKKLKPLIRGSWPGRAAKKSSAKKLRSELLEEVPGFEPAPQIRLDNWWVPRPTEQVHLLWGVEGPPFASKDRFAAFLLNVYLGGGMSSSLFQEIREKNGLAYTVYSNLTSFVDSGLFSIYAATGMGQVALCLRLIEECVEKLKKHLLSDHELQMIKDNLKGTILLSSDSVESRMTSLARNEIFFKRNYSVDEVCRLVDAVRPQDVRRVARQLLSHPERGILALGPKPSRAVAAHLKPSLIKRHAR